MNTYVKQYFIIWKTQLIFLRPTLSVACIKCVYSGIWFKIEVELIYQLSTEKRLTFSISSWHFFCVLGNSVINIIAQSSDTDVVSDPARKRSVMILKMFCSGNTHHIYNVGSNYTINYNSETRTSSKWRFNSDYERVLKLHWTTQKQKTITIVFITRWRLFYDACMAKFVLENWLNSNF